MIKGIDDMRKIVYYYDYTDEDGNHAVIVTSKDYFDAYDCVDDGYSSDYDAISNAMVDCGAEEVMEAEFVLHSQTIDGLIGNMAEKGFILEKNPEFTAFIDSTNS